VSLIAGTVASHVTTHLPRRKAIIGSAAFNLAFLSLYVVSDRLAQAVSPPWSRLFDYGCLVTLLGASFRIGASISPLAFFLPSELLPQSHRSIGIAFISFLFLVLGFLLSGATLPAYESYGIYTFIPLILLPAAISIAYLHHTLPEMKDRQIHEIVADLMR